MRRALDLIHHTITEGVSDCGTAQRPIGFGNLDFVPFTTMERDDPTASEVNTTSTTSGTNHV